ncbi:MAG: hypothetical protein QXF56_02110 [Candidatus Micrarchaeia archaeon]
MRSRFLTFLFLVSVVSAAQLEIELVGAPYFSGCNCKADGTPNTMEISFSLQNPSYRTLYLSYEWYDLSTGSFRKGEKLRCSGGTTTVPPRGYTSCSLSLATMMGGLNGTAKTWVKAIGSDGFEEYMRMVEVTLDYHTSPYEENIVSRMKEVEFAMEKFNVELGSRCYNNLCCGMNRSLQFLQHSLYNLYNANTSLRVCSLTSAWNYVLNASTLLQQANASFMQLKKNCTDAVSLINSTKARVASVAEVVLQGKKCGANVTLSEAALRSANSSLKDAEEAVSVDNYALAFSKLSSANESILLSVKSIGKCIENKTNQTVIPPAVQNTSKEEEQPPDYTLLIIGGAFLIIIIIIAAVAALLLSRVKEVKPTKTTPQAPPSPPPSIPPMTEDLEKEFNEWLESHSKKK